MYAVVFVVSELTESSGLLNSSARLAQIFLVALNLIKIIQLHRDFIMEAYGACCCSLETITELQSLLPHLYHAEMEVANLSKASVKLSLMDLNTRLKKEQH